MQRIAVGRHRHAGLQAVPQRIADVEVGKGAGVELAFREYEESVKKYNPIN